MNVSGRVWNTNEIESIVEDYFDMLQMELVGRQFNKAERNRILQQRLGRTKGSIEYKHQNISAVLAMLDLPFIWGYKPAVNFQARLYEVIGEKLVASDLHTRTLEQRIEMDIPTGGIEFTEPPDKRERRDNANPFIRRIRNRLDPTARDARARKLGEAGERFFFHAEQDRLSSVGRDDLAERVRWVSKEDGDGAGYDILSFTKLGEERWLEVKTTTGPNVTPFWITANELQVSIESPAVFRLIRLYNFARVPAAYKLAPPLSDHVHLDPSQYLAGF